MDRIDDEFGATGSLVKPITVNFDPAARGISAFSALYAYGSTPELKGVEGVIGALMVGGGTYVPTAAAMFAAGYAGGLVGDRFDRAMPGVLLGAFLGAAAAAPVGYTYSVDIVRNGVKPISVNVEAADVVVPENLHYVIDPI